MSESDRDSSTTDSPEVGATGGNSGQAKKLILAKGNCALSGEKGDQACKLKSYRLPRKTYWGFLTPMSVVNK